LESLHHSPFTIYTMVSYMLSNTHIIDQFLDKDEIEIDDIFSDICEVQQVARSIIPQPTAEWQINIEKKPLFDKRLSSTRRYSIDGNTLRSQPIERLPRPKLATFQLVTKIFITQWRDGLIWINPSIQQNYAGPDLHSKIQEHKLTYVPVLFESVERIIHIEAQPFATKADLLLGMRFLAETTYSITENSLTIKLNGTIIQASRTHD